MYTITLRDGKTFQANATDSILDCALHANIQLEHSCKNGRCGACKAPAQGASTLLIDETALSEQERQHGLILTCCRKAAEHLALDLEDLPELANFRPKLTPLRIDALRKLTDDVLEVIVRTPPNSTLKFLPGQHVSISSPSGICRSYSLANAPRADGKLELHIKRVKGGAFSQYWFEQAAPNDLLRLNGPLGTFFLRQNRPAIQHIVFLATGTGIAPVKAMLEQMSQLELSAQGVKSVRVYLGGRTRHELYWQPELHTIQGPLFEFFPCVSREKLANHAEHGYVQTVFAQHIHSKGLNLQHTAVYACGSNPMIQDARRTLLELGLPPHHFYSDAFVSTE